MTTLSPEIEAKVLAKLEALTHDYHRWSYHLSSGVSCPFPRPNQADLRRFFDQLADLAQKDAIDKILSAYVPPRLPPNAKPTDPQYDYLIS